MEARTGASDHVALPRGIGLFAFDRASETVALGRGAMRLRLGTLVVAPQLDHDPTGAT